MNRIQTLLVAAFLMVFCAGVAIGFWLPEPKPGRSGPPWLTDELHLSAEQQARMKEIWGSVREKTRSYPSDSRKELSEKRDRSVRELLSEEQLARYEEIEKNYQNEREALLQSWKAPFEEALSKTREILTPEQYEKFEELRKRRDRGREFHHGDRSPKNEETQEEESPK